MADSFSDDRTEAPTPRRIQQVRRTGQAAISRDLAAAFAIATVYGVFVAAAQAGTTGLVLAMHVALEGATRSTDISVALWAGIEVAVLTLAPPVGALWGGAWLLGVVQTRGLASALPVCPNAKSLSPSLARVLGRDRAIEAGKGAIGLGILFAVAVWTVRPAVLGIAALGGAGAAQVLCAVGTLGERLTIRGVVAMLVLGVADLLLQRHRHGKALRMSRDEVKREHRESEGEPDQKAERLRLHRECMHEQTLNDVAKADFVVVHARALAVAIRYDQEGSGAPIVMVKGQCGNAQSIEEIARAAGVSVFVDPELVRALASVDDGGEIPEALYQQVAEWLVRARAFGHTAS